MCISLLIKIFILVQTSQCFNSNHRLSSYVQFKLSWFFKSLQITYYFVQSILVIITPKFSAFLLTILASQTTPSGDLFFLRLKIYPLAIPLVELYWWWRLSILCLKTPLFCPSSRYFQWVDNSSYLLSALWSYFIVFWLQLLLLRS